MRNEKSQPDDFTKRPFKAQGLMSVIKHFEKRREATPFRVYINRLCGERDIAPARIINKSGIERTFGHQIFNGRRNPSRDNVIRIAFGFGLDYGKTQDLLQMARKSPLYPKIQRDAVIIHALKNGLDIAGVQAMLHELSLPLLGEARSCD